MLLTVDVSQGWTDHRTTTTTAFKRFRPVAVYVLCNLKLMDPGHSMRDTSQTQGITLWLEQQLKHEAEESKLLQRNFPKSIIKKNNILFLIGSGQPSPGRGEEGEMGKSVDKMSAVPAYHILTLLGDQSHNKFMCSKVNHDINAKMRFISSPESKVPY